MAAGSFSHKLSDLEEVGVPGKLCGWCTAQFSGSHRLSSDAEESGQLGETWVPGSCLLGHCGLGLAYGMDAPNLMEWLNIPDLLTESLGVTLSWVRVYVVYGTCVYMCVFVGCVFRYRRGRSTVKLVFSTHTHTHTHTNLRWTQSAITMTNMDCGLIKL